MTGLSASGLLLAALAVAAPVVPTPRRPPPGKRSRTLVVRSAGAARPRRLAPGDRISLDVKDADIRDVLRSFGELAGANIAIDPEVRGSVTVRLTDVRWEDALEVILRSNGLAVEGDPRILRVGTPASLAGAPTR
ncbi:MAG TPA: secretin and TonB N-terminal domain-containing protein [Thermoanaerobaculia bacterium]|nr:secretin and TonB N-terminal domain-containing protein [Thermoanaerobaculia bacterium]